ncbi:MAG TPA: MFS transporter [Phycisphaerales bacterium]|nr:MFS transporter [Phycisphaerales bacterium]
MESSEIALAPAPAPSVRASGVVLAPHAFDTKKRQRSLAVPFWSLVGSHTVTDIYPIFWATLVLVFRRDLNLTDTQIAIIYGTNAIMSGLPQGLFAWLSDRYNTRLCAPVGLFLSALCLSSMGWATSFEQVLALSIIGQTGNGIYHPIAAALAGQMGGKLLKGGRAPAVSVFFAAGVLGGIIGPIACSSINSHFGVSHLGWLMIPGVLTAGALLFLTRGLSHRHANHHEIRANISKAESAHRWRTVWLLFTGNCLRFIVNTAMFVLFPIWAASRYPGESQVNQATELNGTVIIAMQIGMGIFAIVAARLVPQGRERQAIFGLSVAGAIFTALTGFAGSYVGMPAMYLCAGLAGLGFAAILPITIALAQRLLPGRTGLASSLMMGVAWSAAALAPWFAKFFFGNVGLKEAESLAPWRIDLAFTGFGVLLLIAGALSLLMSPALLKKVAEHH